MISIITPFYNSDKFLSEAIQSVLAQSFMDWELLLINDGSTDRSKEIALSFLDSRIKYFEQKNKGVSAARNLGLANMKGDYFCFLDADDLLPQNSLSSRLDVFKHNSKIEFVDGKVEVFNTTTGKTIRQYKPTFIGNPFNELIALSGKCFFGPTWMIKQKANKSYRFKGGMTHGEDLLFYISIAGTGNYTYTNDLVYKYREGNNSAMSKLSQLENGYFEILTTISSWPNVSDQMIKDFHHLIRRIMFKSYLSKFDVINAINVIFR